MYATRPTSALQRAAEAMLLSAAVGCGFGDASLDALDPGAAPATPSWSADVQPLMDLYCTACHAEDAQPGRVEGYGYGTCEETREERNWEGFERSVFVENEMPPGGAPRLRESELLTLRRWADQGFRCD